MKQCTGEPYSSHYLCYRVSLSHHISYLICQFTVIILHDHLTFFTCYFKNKYNVKVKIIVNTCTAVVNYNIQLSLANHTIGCTKRCDYSVKFLHQILFFCLAGF